MIRVLVVEDEPLILEAHQVFLARLRGFELAGTASTARDAMRKVAAAAATETPIDLVLLDIGLPDVSGIDLAGSLAAVRPAPDIIAITSERDLSVVRSAVSKGVLLYLLKPFTFAAFRDKLERYERYREALPEGRDAVSQRDVDRAMSELRSADERSTAQKGVASGTTDQVAVLVRDTPGGLTASDVASTLGVSRVTAWRYLERLADDRIVDRGTDYGRAGRPQVRYTWRT